MISILLFTLLLLLQYSSVCHGIFFSSPVSSSISSGKPVFSPLRRFFLPKNFTNHTLLSMMNTLRNTFLKEIGDESSIFKKLDAHFSNFSSFFCLSPNNARCKPDTSESVQPTVLEELYSMVKTYCGFDSSEHWENLGSEEDIIIWRLKRSLLGIEEAEKWPCIRSFTVIDVPFESLGKYLLDSKNAPLFNKYCSQKVDVEIVDRGTKVTWNKTKAPFNIKPFDFCSIVHTYQNATERSLYIVSKGITHNKVPIQEEFVRAEILFGLNILTPNSHDQTKTDFTSFSHVKYTGTPSIFAWRNGFSGTVSYLKHLKEVAISLHHHHHQLQQEEE